MIVALNEAKGWLHIDWDDEDNEITDLINASELYLFNATDKTYDSTNSLAKLYCRVLIADWYDNKGLMQDNNVSDKVRFTLQSILLQLQYMG